MKIIQLTAENVKKLKAIEIVPNGDFVQVTGRNGSGKSSVLDSIWWALAGKDGIQDRPIRDGADRARIRLDLGEIVVERRFTPNGTTLIVENGEGARFPSPQAMLDKLVGQLSFDPLSFAHMKPRDQYEEIKRVAKIDLDLDAIEVQNKADFDRRRDKNREAKEQLAAANSIVIKFPDMTEPVDTAALVKELEAVNKWNSDIDARQFHRKQLESQLETAEARIEELKRQMNEAAERANRIRFEIERLPAPLPAKDAAPIREQIAGAEARNADWRRRETGADHLARAKAAEAEADKLSKRIDDRNEQKAKALESAAMPVPGLTLGEGRVTLNGVPFDQCSSAEQLRTSVAIAMAANPKIRVIRIKDGSLLDDDGLRVIQELAATQDYQVWIERVDSSGKIGIVMEDGAVRAVNEPTAESAALGGVA